jgi:type II secretory pathway component PulF
MKSSNSPVALIILLVLHAIFGALLLWSLFVFVPTHEKIFKDFGVRLPRITLAVINLSEWFTSYWYVAIPALFGGDFAALFALHRASKTRWMTAWGVAVCLGAVLMIGLTLVAVIVPMNELTKNLNR